MIAAMLKLTVMTLLIAVALMAAAEIGWHKASPTIRPADRGGADGRRRDRLAQSVADDTVSRVQAQHGVAPQAVVAQARRLMAVLLTSH
jgi:hypothetical protein